MSHCSGGCRCVGELPLHGAAGRYTEDGGLLCRDRQGGWDDKLCTARVDVDVLCRGTVVWEVDRC